MNNKNKFELSDLVEFVKAMPEPYKINFKVNRIKFRIRYFFCTLKYIRPIAWVRKQFRNDDELPF